MSRTHDDGQLTAMWLAHHFPEDYDRCVSIGRRHVCRRCLTLYPLAFAVMVATLLLSPKSSDVDIAIMVLLPLPAVVEFVLEQLGRIEYRPLRQTIVTVPLAIALGRGFAIYLHHPTSLLFWGTVGLYGGLCLGVLVWRTFERGRHQDD